jgi:TRAP transporter 4TM/12TM fusion protein
MKQRGLLMGPAIFIVFATRPFRKNGKSGLIDALIGLAGMAGVFHFVLTEWDLMMRGGAPLPTDIVWGVIVLLTLLEGSRRCLGIALPLIASIFLLYGYFGPFFPGVLQHHGVNFEHLVSATAMTTEGIWGTPMQIAATYIIIFVIFTSFLEKTGAGQFFIDLACALFGRVRGGPAKIAVAGSAIFGTISGSALANVAGTGCITIPLMKENGYRAEFAGAVEAAASTGGQLMPPVMGAAAFVMAEFVGVSYWQVAKAALIPAILYFFAIFMMVDLEAARTGLKGVSNLTAKTKTILKEGWFLMLPLILLIYLMGVVQFSPMKSAFWSLVCTVGVSFLNRKSMLTPSKILDAIYSGVKDTAGIAMACATAGIVISMVNLSGLGLSFSSILISLSQGNLFALLCLTAIASLVMGMGLPATPCYILLAILVSPAITELGVPIMASHLFVYYFGMISGITPPVALAAYVAAGIAQAKSMRTAVIATKLGMAGFLLPFMFCYSPALLMQGTYAETAIATISGLVGVVALASALTGHLFAGMKLWQRPVLGIAALLLIYPEISTDLAGYGLAVVMAYINRRTI